MIELFRNLLCVVGGAALGYYLAHIHLETKYLERADQESEQSKKYYKEKYERLIAHEAGLVTEAAEAMTGYAAAKKDVEEIEALTDPKTERRLLNTDLDEAVKKVADGTSKPKAADESGVLAQPIPKKNYNHISTPPKVTETSEASASSEEDDLEIEFITSDDFVDDQFGYKQIMLTYWAGDDILSNEKEQPILGSARDVSIGLEALAKLKDGDETVYVRNRSGKWEFEITRDAKKYTDVVGPVVADPDAQIDATE